MFKRLLGSLGAGGPTVDTVLPAWTAAPGGTVSGQVHLRGGSGDFDIEHITLELVAGDEVFDRFVVGGGFRLVAGAEHSVPFTVTLPWETPITELYGQDLGITLGVRTELAVAGGKDTGDLDRLAVGPLPVQEAILEAFGRLGFGFTSADLEYGHIGGTGQRLPFYQEIDLAPAPQYAYALYELEVAFLAAPDGMEVVLEADKHRGHDTLTRFTVSHDEVRHQDWTSVVDGWMRELTARCEHWHSFSDDYADTGPGMGTAVAAGAAGLAVGVVGGMVAAEVVDEVGDFFEGDDEDDEGDDESGED
ncbi:MULTISPECIES: sporulation protein [unclassified Streptomyces]|uniref:sporulation protein n=1 Tax=unclassified Streptomyces TaxID=2593676 RepID=UPI00278BFDCE|nr:MULTISPECIES: sporulation protein [unclassified Streptomyces]